MTKNDFYLSKWLSGAKQDLWEFPANPTAGRAARLSVIAAGWLGSIIFKRRWCGRLLQKLHMAQTAHISAAMPGVSR